jgi:hypothetical protein
MHSYIYCLNRSIISVLEQQNNCISYINIQNLNVSYVRHYSVPYHKHVRTGIFPQMVKFNTGELHILPLTNNECDKL